MAIVGYSATDQALQLRAKVSTEVTTDTSSSAGAFEAIGQLISSNTVGAMADTANAFVVKNHTSTRMIIKGNGALHATTVTARATEGGFDQDATGLDGEDDIGLVRTFERTVHKDMGIAMTEWDKQIKVNENDLKRIGVLSSDGSFYNMQRMNSLLGGAIWKQHTRQCATEEREMFLMQLLEEDTPGITARMQTKLAEAQMPQLPI